MWSQANLKVRTGLFIFIFGLLFVLTYGLESHTIHTAAAPAKGLEFDRYGGKFCFASCPT